MVRAEGDVRTMTRIRLVIAVLAVVTMVGLAACGTAAQDVGSAVSEPVDDGGDAVAGACLEGEPDCIDTPQLAEGEPVEIDETGIAQFRRDAQHYLGATQDELSEHVRIGRIGDEHMALTEDYQIGRITVELDDIDGDGTPVVTSATVELPDGPETFELDQ
jgi:hypothetical protein